MTCIELLNERLNILCSGICEKIEMRLEGFSRMLKDIIKSLRVD